MWDNSETCEMTIPGNIDMTVNPKTEQFTHAETWTEHKSVAVNINL